MYKLPKNLICLFVFLSWTPRVMAETTIRKSYGHHVLVHGVYTNLTTDKVAVSGPAVHGALNYFLSRNVALEAGYFTMNDATGSTLLSGFDGSVKWYLLSPGSEITINGNGMKLHSYSTWTHYVLGGFMQRQFGIEAAAIPYSGLAFGYGFNWHIGKQFASKMARQVYLSLQGSRESLSSQTKEKISVTNVALGVGTIL